MALNLRGLSYEQVAIDLHSERHLGEACKAINPQQLVPALDTGGDVLTQSHAILEWLEERYPKPAPLPTDLLQLAQVRALAAIVGCDIHPVNNRRILEALRHRFSADDTAGNDWCATWIRVGFDAFDALVRAQGWGPFAFGAQPIHGSVYSTITRNSS
jgi:maleylpyruvate isomerase